MKNEELVKQLTSPSKNSRLEKFGKTITFLCLALIVFIVAMILLFVAQKGLATFFVNKVSLIEFLFSGDWSPSEGKFGALPMIQSTKNDLGIIRSDFTNSLGCKPICYWSSHLYD